MDSLFLFYAHSRSLFPGVKQEFEHISFVVIVCPLNLEKWTGRFVTQKEIGWGRHVVLVCSPITGRMRYVDCKLGAILNYNSETLWLKTNKQAINTTNNSNNTPPRPHKQRNQFNDIMPVQTKQKLRVSRLSASFSWSSSGPRCWPWNARSFRKNSGTRTVLRYSKTQPSSLQLPNVTYPWDTKLFYLFCVVSGGEVFKYTHDSRKWHQERNSLRGSSLCLLVLPRSGSACQASFLSIPSFRHHSYSGHHHHIHSRKGMQEHLVVSPC